MIIVFIVKIINSVSYYNRQSIVVFIVKSLIYH